MTILKRYPLILILPIYISWHFLFLLHVDPTLLLTYPEELQRGTIAKEIVEGLKAPLVGYMPDSYSGGSLVIGILASLPFKFLGPTLFSLKLVPIAIFTLALLFWFLAIKHVFSQRAAIYFALLYTFAPFAFVQFCQSHMGDHPETILFTGLSIYLFFKIIYPPNEKKPLEWLPYLLLGTVAGFGIWFAYIYVLVVISILLFWFLKNPAFWFRKSFLLFIFGFLFGFSPWILINAEHLMNSVNIHGQPAWHFFDPTRLFEFFTHYQNTVPFRFLTSFAPPWMHAPSMLWKATNVVWMTLYFIPFYFAFFTGFEKHLRDFKFKPTKPIDFFLIYTIIFFFFSQLSTFRSIRFMIPAYPLLFLFVAIALDKMSLSKSRRGQAIATAIANLLVVLGLLSTLTTYSMPHAKVSLSAKGYNYFYLGYWPDKSTYAICGSPETCVKNYPKFEEALNEIDRHTFSMALGMYLQDQIEDHNFAENKVTKTIKQIPKELEPYFFYTLGFRVHSQAETLGEAFDRLSFVEDLTPKNSDMTLQGILDGWGDNGGTIFSADEAQSLKRSVPPTARPLYWRAVGQRMVWAFLDERRTAIHLKLAIHRVLEYIPTDFHSEFLIGAGKTLAQTRYLESLPETLTEIEDYPFSWQEPLFQGVGMAIVSSEHLDSNPLLEQTLISEISGTSLSYLHIGKKMFIDLFKPRED